MAADTPSARSALIRSSLRRPAGVAVIEALRRRSAAARSCRRPPGSWPSSSAATGTALGLFASVFPIGGILGPVLGGVVLTYWSWRGIFLVNVPIGILLVICASLLIPRTGRHVRGRLDGLGVLLVGTTLLPAMFGIAYLGSASASFASPAFVLPEVLAAVSLALFVRHARRAPAPFIPARLLVGRGFGVMNLLNFLYGAAALGFSALVPLYAAQRFGIASLEAGTLLTARAVGMISTAALAALLLRRTGHRWPMVIGYLVVIVGMLGLA